MNAITTPSPMSHTQSASPLTEGSDVFQELLGKVRQISERQAIPQVQPMELRSFDELERWAKIAARSSMVPKAYQGKPDDIILAVQMGAELGLRPMQSLQNIAVINGKPSVYGDAMLALCMGHPLYVSTDERIEGSGDDRKAICTTIRKGSPPVIRTFSVLDAKTAKLWMKKSYTGQDTPWITNPDRMLQFRARGFALRDAFPDKLRGLISAEEAADYPNTDTPASAAPALESAGTREAINAAVPLAEPPKKPTWADWLDERAADFGGAHTRDAVDAILARDDVHKAMDGALKNGGLARLKAMIAEAIQRTSGTDEDGPDGDLGHAEASAEQPA
jgi:hypothetical protein